MLAVQYHYELHLYWWTLQHMILHPEPTIPVLRSEWWMCIAHPVFTSHRPTIFVSCFCHHSLFPTLAKCFRSDCGRLFDFIQINLTCFVLISSCILISLMFSSILRMCLLQDLQFWFDTCFVTLKFLDRNILIFQLHDGLFSTLPWDKISHFKV